MLNQIKLLTEFGELLLQLDTESAPHTSNYFLNAAATGTLNDTRIFRIVTEQNAKIRYNARIEVVQLGVECEESAVFTKLPHEATNLTGLSHKKWTVSAARYDVGQNYPSFFICMRDEPVLNHGGERHPDGQGFAAFGSLIGGFEVVKKLFDQAEPEEFLTAELKIVSATVL